MIISLVKITKPGRALHHIINYEIEEKMHACLSNAAMRKVMAGTEF